MSDDQETFEKAMLADATLKARALIEELKKSQLQTEPAPPDLAPEQLANGRTALQAAIDSAERMLGSLQEAAAAHAANQDIPPA